MLMRRIGTTSEEVEHHLGMLHQTCSSRRTDLRNYGYTDFYRVDGIILRRLNLSGKPAQVQIATPRGMDVIRLGLPIIFGGKRSRDPTEPYHGGNEASREAFNSSNFEFCARRVLAFMCRFTP